MERIHATASDQGRSGPVRPEKQPELLTEQQFAELCQLSLRTVKKLVSELGGRINSGVVRFGRSVRIRPEPFLETIAKHREKEAKKSNGRNGKKR